jgi:hypothetical protein
MAADLFDFDDFAAYLKTDIDVATATVARRIAGSKIRAYIRADPKPFDGSRTVYLPVDDCGVVWLPRLLDTVSAVASTVDVSLLHTWRTGGRSLVVTYPWQAANTSLLYRQQPEVKVTYTYATVPEEVRDAALIIAADVYGPGALSGGSTDGIRSESIDDYSVTYDGGADTADAGIPADAKALLAPYRSPSRSVRLASR